VIFRRKAASVYRLEMFDLRAGRRDERERVVMSVVEQKEDEEELLRAV